MNENLNKVVKFITDGWKQWKISREGGFQGKEVFDFIPVLLQLPNLLSGETKAGIISEWNARTKESIEALLNYAKTESGEDSEEFVAIVGVVAAALVLQLAFKKEPVLVNPVNP